MNKAITDGLVLMPPEFAAGLDVWSSGDGTPGSDTYDGDPDAALIPADQDFGGCLELLKTTGTQMLRSMGQTPILPGCYLQIKARVKAVSGALPAVRIAAWAGLTGGAHATGLIEFGPSVNLTTYGDVVEVSAIVGTGTRGGVDMPWGTAPVYGHFGLDLTGANGGTVRIDDITIEDVTNVWSAQLRNTVDVIDYGAIGDGVTDNVAAFEAADTAAAGREVIIPDGVYYLADHVTFENPARFTGTVTMPDDKRLALTQNFDLPAYIDAFGTELLAFKKAVAALFNFSDHESLDLGGRQITLDAPVDIQAAVVNKTSYSSRRVIRNGMFDCVTSVAWDDDITTSTGTYSAANDDRLTNVTNVASIPVGARVTGTGVGREIYVQAVNIGGLELTLSQPLYDAEGTQVFTFTRHKYALDFSGFDSLSRFVLDDIEFKCNGNASAVMLASGGIIFHIRDCFFTLPKDRGITSAGTGCQGMLIDRCQFLSNEQALPAQDRVSVGFNSNANDNKIRDNRAVRFAHFGVVGGTGHLISGNHWFQGDSEPAGLRQAGLVVASANCKTTIVGNYIDNNFIEWSNEYDSAPGFLSEFSFGGLTTSANIFAAADTATWFNFIVVKPYGSGHFINGFNVSGNSFKSTTTTLDNVEHADDSIAGLDYSRMRNIRWDGNSYTGITKKTQNPVVVSWSEATDSLSWDVDFEPYLPFDAWARNATALVAEGRINKGADVQVTDMPYVTPETGVGKNQIRVTWAEACKGSILLTGRMDNPV